MNLHYYTIQRLTLELNQNFGGGKILASFSQQKNEQILEVNQASGLSQYLHISVDAQYPFVLQQNTWKRAKNSANILNELLGLKIQKIDLLENERIVEITFLDSSDRYLIHLFRNHANAFLLNGDGQIRNSFKSAKKHISKKYEIKPATLPALSDLTLDAFRQQIPTDRPMPLAFFLQKHFLFQPKIITREICFRAGISVDTDINALSSAQIQNVYNSAHEIFTEARTESPRVYLDEGVPVKFALFPLNHLAIKDYRDFDSINAALRFFIFKKQRGETLSQKREKNLALLEKKNNQILHVLAQLKNLPDEKSQQEKYRKIGDLILAHLHNIPQGAEEILLDDYFDPDLSKIAVKLNKQISAAENAQQYFNRAKQVTEKLLEVKQRIKYLEKQQQKVLVIKEKLEQTSDFKTLGKIEKQLLELHILQTDVEKMEGVFKPYKTAFYKNWEIWIGKNAKSNDEMTFRHAHKEDFWLHAQGVSGSHVIIRNPKRLEQIPAEVVEYAGRLAAGQSPAKHSSYVPVMVTRVKYVRKPRGSAAGAVIPERIKSVFVEPKF